MSPHHDAGRRRAGIHTVGWRIQDRNRTGQRRGRAPAPALGLSLRARACAGSRWQDGLPDAPREATGVESGGARTLRAVRVEPQELVPESPLELAAAGGRWPRRARRERGDPEGLNQRRLATTVSVSHFM